MCRDDDYPDEVEELLQSFVADTKDSSSPVLDTGIEDAVWEVARQSTTLPHFGNLIVAEIYSRLNKHISDVYGDAIETAQWVNAIGSSFDINGVTIYSYDDLLIHTNS